MELTRYELDNGLTVILHRSAAAPVVACNVWVGVGSADEEPRQAGLAHVHEHMLFKGTDSRQVGQLAREVEAAGGHINAFTSFDQTCYYVAMSSRYFDTGLDVLSDAIGHSSFEADELASELEVIQEEIKRGKDSPARQIGLKLFETAYAEHPYRRPVIGTSESVDSFDRSDVLDFYHHHYVPQNMALVVVGDFEVDQAKQLVDTYFSGLHHSEYTQRDRLGEPEQDGFRGWADGADINQAHLRIGFHIPHATHEDIPALDLLGAILGYGDSSHLYGAIQRERDLVSSISAGAYTPKDAGLFMVSAQYQLPEEGRDDRDVIGAIAKEIFRFRHIRPSLVDLQRARTIIESQEIYGKQTVQGLAMKIGRYQMVTGDPHYEQTYYRAIHEVTPADVRRVADRYLSPENATVALSHPNSRKHVSVDELGETIHRAHRASKADHFEESVDLDDEGFARIDMPDGPILIIQEDHSVETFSIRALRLGGLRDEQPPNNGINSLLSELIDKGTSEWSATEIAHRVESMAGSLGGMAGRHSFGLSMSGLSQFFEQSFELFAGCLLDAAIPDEEFDRQKRLQLEHIRSRRDRLAAVNYEQFSAAFFDPHPYGMPSDGTNESISELTADQVRAYYRSLIDPREMVLAVVGDVDVELVEQLAERYIGGQEAVDARRPDLPDIPAVTQPNLVVGDLEKQQAHIIAGFQTPPLTSEDKYPLEVLYAILSGQGGRLFYELRDKQSLAYSVGARVLFGLDASALVVTIGTSPEKISRAIDGIVAEIRRLREATISSEEVDRARRYLAGSHDLGLQKHSARSLTVGLDELYGLGYKRSLEFGARIDEVTVDEIQRVIDQFIDPQKMVVSVVKPRATEVADDLLDQIL